jgi:putative ABC transport system permease protein
MNKKLIKQIRNEWRSNLWIFTELLIVSVVMWFVVDYMYVKISNYNSPRGFDISHCYLISVNKLTPQSREYNPADTSYNDDKAELLNRIQHRPDIEAASLSIASYPYDGSNGTVIIGYDTIKVGTDSWVVRRLVTPDFVRVFRYEGVNGETPEQLAKLLKQGKILLSDNLFNEHNIPSLRNYVGKGFKLDIDSTKKYILGASLKPVKYMDAYNVKHSFCMVIALDKEYYDEMGELCVRVKDNMDKDFINTLWKDADKQLRVGNLFISNIQSFQNIRTNYQRSWTNDMRAYLVGGAFLMLNIFLGILGTFWFRTQQRKGEIALFKVLGSSNRDVFVREIKEGLILLSAATVIAAIIDLNIAYAGLNTGTDGVTLEAGRFITTVLISYLLIALMIVIGIWFPAKKAMKIQPAEALHEE